MSASRDDTAVCLGAIAGAHGVRGDVRIKTFTEDPLDIAAYGPVRTEDGRTFTFGAIREAKGGVVASLEGVKDRDEADALKGTRLYVDRDRLGEPEEDDTWYHADLIGLEVRLEDGTKLGEVAAIHDFGAGDLVDVRLEGSRKTVLLPFTAEVVPKVDIAAGVITVVPPDGLFDEEPE